MIQLVVNGIFLDLYENDPPKLTYSIEDITDTKITTVFSKNFRVPATKTNTEFFKTAFEVNGFDFDVTVTVNAELYFDGNLLKQGQIRLQKIYLTNAGNAADYEIIFLGETRTLASELGDKLVSQLDYSEFDMPLTYTNISQSWEAYYGVGTTNYNGGLFSGSILFPLVDFGNTYSGSNNTSEQGTITLTEDKPFVNSANALGINRFKPMIRAKVIWDKIFSGSNFTYDSEFLESDSFRHLYISAWGNEADIDIEPFISGSDDVFTAEGGDTYEIWDGSSTNPTSASFIANAFLNPGGGYNPVTGIYTVPLTGTYTFQYKLYHQIKFDNMSQANWNSWNFDSELTFRLRKISSGVTSNITSTTWTEATTNGAGQRVYTKSSYFANSLWTTGTFIKTQVATLNAGDQVYVDFSWVVANNADVDYIKVFPGVGASYFKCTTAPGNFSVTPLIKNDYKQIDFIKDIATKFRLVIAPDKSNPNNLIVEPWPDYISSGDIFDWTGKLDLSKDITIEPLFNTQKKKINFKDKADGDYWNKYNETAYGEIFGTLKVDADNDLLTDERTITTNLSPTVINMIRDWPQYSSNFTTFIIPHIYTIEAAPSKLLYKPIVPNTRLLFYNGLTDPGQLGLDPTPSWWIKDEASVAREIVDVFPRVSPYSTKTMNDSTIDLNWQREVGYFYDGTSDEPTAGNSVYDLYWLEYIDSLYYKWSRKVSAYFVLDAVDLQNFSFDDVIFVKGTYYYIEKIYDAPLDKKESIKVDLIKLNNFTVPDTNFIPYAPTDLNVWGTWGVIWEVTTDTWDE
jgi:hypothetical protein